MILYRPHLPPSGLPPVLHFFLVYLLFVAGSSAAALLKHQSRHNFCVVVFVERQFVVPNELGGALSNDYGAGSDELAPRIFGNIRGPYSESEMLKERMSQLC